MKKIRYTYLAVMAIVLAGNAAAQNTRSGYFVEDYTYRFQLNPAYDNTRNFIAMPALGNVNVAMNGTLAVSDVIYNVDGRTTTFLNPGVSAQEVMGNLDDRNRIGADVSLTMLAAGFKAFGGYNTVAVNVRGSVGVQVPKSIFSLLKEGAANRTYDISDVSAFANAYGEISLGHSHRLGNKWRIGGNLKFLVGGANIDAVLNQASLTLGEDDWSVTAQGDINASVKGLSYKTKINDRTNHRYVSGAKVDGTGVNGFGVAVDIGAVYTPSQDWTLSVALLDFGFISWNNNMLASTNGVKSFNTDRYTFNVDDDATNSFSGEWDKLRDDFSAIYELEDMGDAGSRTRMLGATVNAAVEYKLPAYRKLSFGLLNTTRIQGEYSWTDFRLSANIAPARCFSATANLSVGTFGVGFGWLLNFHTKGFNLFAGMDRTMAKVTKQFVPLNSNASVNIGINFPF